MNDQAEAKRYNELPEETREFLESLDKDTISTLQKWLIVWKAAGIVGRLLFTAGVALLGVFVAIPGAVEGFRLIMKAIGRGN
ncbi:MAG: hypothetical protein J0H11_14945 [Rhizobiales bacterium]|nr:hypothetical protein [Hyphomicrobiales bacterium]